MRTKPNPKLIGAFVLGAVAIAIAGILSLGSLTYFERKLPFVMYFDGNVGGLEVGAPVNFRGARVGTITDIRIQVAPREGIVRIPVYAEFEANRFELIGERPANPGENNARLIEKGLRAQLASQSLVTGKLQVELDFHPDTPARLVEGDKSVVQIPTIPTSIEEVQASIQRVLDMLAQSSLPELVTDVRTLAQGLTRTLGEAQVGRLAESADALLKSLQALAGNTNEHVNAAGGETTALVQELRQLTQKVDQRADQVATNADAALIDAREAAARISRALDGVDRMTQNANRVLTSANVMIEPGSPLQRELVLALREIAGASRSLRALADELERNPNSVLFGKASGRPR